MLELYPGSWMRGSSILYAVGRRRGVGFRGMLRREEEEAELHTPLDACEEDDQAAPSFSDLHSKEAEDLLQNLFIDHGEGLQAEQIASFMGSDEEQHAHTLLDAGSEEDPEVLQSVCTDLGVEEQAEQAASDVGFEEEQAVQTQDIPEHVLQDYESSLKEALQLQTQRGAESFLASLRSTRLVRRPADFEEPPMVCEMLRRLLPAVLASHNVREKQTKRWIRSAYRSCLHDFKSGQPFLSRMFFRAGAAHAVAHALETLVRPAAQEPLRRKLNPKTLHECLSKARERLCKNKGSGRYFVDVRVASQHTEAEWQQLFKRDDVRWVYTRSGWQGFTEAHAMAMWLNQNYPRQLCMTWWAHAHPHSKRAPPLAPRHVKSLTRFLQGSNSTTPLYSVQRRS